MKFPRNARILRSQLDAAPLASVFFVLVMFTMLASLVYTPGIHVELPVADAPAGGNDLPGTDQRAFRVALDANNRLFHANQLVTEAELRTLLAQAVSNSPQPLTLVVQADKAVTLESYTRLTLLARDVGVRQSLFQTQPRMGAAPTP